MDKVVRDWRFAALMPLVTLLVLGALLFWTGGISMWDGGLTGMPILNTTVIVMNATPTACNTTFYSGWNLVSIACMRNQEDIAVVLRSVNGSFASVHTYMGDGVPDPWKAYNPSLPSWVVQDFRVVNRKSGFWINMARQSGYYRQDDVLNPNYINLVRGWNLVGYPTLGTRPISNATQSLVPSMKYIYAYNATDGDHYKMYAWNSSLPSDQDLYTTFPYHAYWIYLDSPDTWVIDW